MSESIPSPDQPAELDPSAPIGDPRIKRRRRRVPRWAKIIGGLFVLLLLLVLFAPTIASTAPARSLVLAKVNANLNGTVAIDDWSFGWFSGTSLSGLRVLDASRQPILTLASLTSDLSVADILRGNYSIGDAVIDGLEFHITREADGELNIARLSRPDTQSPEKEKRATPPDERAAHSRSKLPDASGILTIRNSKGTYEDSIKKQAVQFASIDGSVNISGINAPIQNSLNIVVVSEGRQGTLKASGTINLAGNNQLADQPGIDETIKIEGLDQSAITALLPPGGIERMEGTTNASFIVKVVPGAAGILSGELRTANLSASGPALKGDTFSAKELVLAIPPTTIDLSPGSGGKWQNWPIRTGTAEKSDGITLALAQANYADTVKLKVNATAQSLMNFAENLKPGAAGEVALNVDVNLGGLSRLLPHCFPEHEGRRLSAGKLSHTTRIKLGPDSTQIAEETHLRDLAVTTAAGATEPMQPVDHTLGAISYGGGWALPDLREINLTLTSAFANVQFTGKELTQLSGNARGDLARAQRELGQILPMDNMMALGGTFDIVLKTTGDVTQPTAPLDLALLANISGLQLDGVAGFQQFRQRITRVQASTRIIRTSHGVEGLDDVKVIALSGASERDLTLDASLTAAVKYVQGTHVNPATGQSEPMRVATVPRFSLERANLNLAAAQRDFPDAFTTFRDRGVRMQTGTLGLSGSGSYSTDSLTFDLKGGIDRLNLVRENKPVLSNYTLMLDAAGSDASELRVSRLHLSDNTRMLDIAAGTDGLIIPAAGGKLSGEVSLGVDLKKLTDLARALGETPPTDDGPRLLSGRVDGTLRLAPSADNFVALTGQLDAGGISVQTQGEPIRNEKLAINIAAHANPDFSQISIDSLTAAGRLVNARLTEIVLDQAAGSAPGAPPLAMVQKANAVIDIPRLGDLHALILAIAPPEKSDPGKPAGQITAGSANLRLALAHEGADIVITPEIVGKGVTLGAVDASKNIGDIELRTAIRMSPAEHPPADATFMGKLREFSIPAFTARLAGADLRLESPLVIKDPDGAFSAFRAATTQSLMPRRQTAALAAVFVGDINLAELCETLEAWNGAKRATMYPYAGHVQFREEFSTSGGGVFSLAGRADVTDFTTTGAAAHFAEKHLALANSINLDPTADALQINDLSIATDTTGAIRLALSGTILDLDSERKLDLAVDLEHDAKPLWDILRPLLDPQTGGKSLEEWTMSGKRSQRMVITGSFPGNDQHPIRFVSATGSFGLDTLAGKGLEISQLDLKFLLDKGILHLEHAGPPISDKLPPAAACNHGIISLHGFSIDFTGDHARLFAPDEHPLIQGASINPVFANSVIGRFVNPAFEGATQAQGLLYITVVNCKGLALDKAMQSSNPAESGRAELRVTLKDIFLGQPELVSLVSKLKPNALNENGFKGEVREGRVVVEGGQVKSDLTFQIDKYALKFAGGIGMAQNKLIDFFVLLPQSLFAAIDKNLTRVVPADGYRIALTGTTDNWIQNAGKSIVPMIADLGFRVGLDRLIGGATGRDKENGGANAAEPSAPRTPGDLLGDLLDSALRGDKKENKKPQAAQPPRNARQQAAPATQPTTAPAQLSKKERERLKKEKEREEKERKREEKRKQADR